MSDPDDVTSSTHVARRYLVAGMVQGVGFRWHTRHIGQELRLAGWVKNLPDGRVEARAAGSAEAVAAFGDFLRRGPPSSQVSHVEEEALPPEEVAELPRSFQVAF